MKTAIYIEDGLTQIVLTPESDFEKSVVGKIDADAQLSVKRGSFYECRGGYVRQSGKDDSIILVSDKPLKASP